MKKTYRCFLTCVAGLCLALLVMPGAAAACDHPDSARVGSARIEPDCVNPGVNEGWTCMECGYNYGGGPISALGHSWVYETENPTCTSDGRRIRYCNRDGCGLVEVLEVLPKLGHHYQHCDEIPSTNCQPGVPERQVCDRDRCGDVVILGDAPAPARPHNITVVVEETEERTRGEWCGDCNKWILMSVDKAPDRHNCADYAEPIPTVEPTCTTNGHRGGVQCSVCDKVLENSSVIPARGHTEQVTLSGRAPTCTGEGRTEEIRCSECGYVIQRSETIRPTGHRPVIDERVEPTETATGLTEGSHCGVCGTVLVAQQVIPAKGGSTGGTESPASSGDDETLGDEDLGDEDIPLAEKPFLFEDVAKGKWYYDAIYYVYQRGLMNGNNKSGTLFSPNENTNRAMIVTILDMLTAENDLADLMVPLAGEPKSFPDVEAGKWYTEHVLWATAAGIVGGYKEGTFGPLDDVTREQLVVILYQYAGKLGADRTGRADLSGYEDATRVSGYAREAMEWAVDLGLLTGRKDGGVVRLEPKGTATRAEVAVVMMNFCKLVVDAE